MAEIRDVVRDMFSMLSGDSERWARDWLLSWDSDAVGDVSAFANPMAYPHRDSVALMRTPDHVSLGDVGQSCNAIVTFIPSWSQGGVTVGVLAKLALNTQDRILNTLCPTADGKGFLSVGRFVRNEATGELLLIGASDAVGTREGLCHVVHFRHHSTTLRQHNFLLCSHDMLRARVKDLHAFENSALLAEASLDVRERGCPVCWKVPTRGASCGCALPLACPKSPLDFSAFSANSKALHSDFRCAGTMFVSEQAALRQGLTSARAFSQALRMSNVAADEFGMGDLADSLQSLAIQQRMSGANPCRLALPASVAHMAQGGGVSADAQGMLEAEAGIALPVTSERGVSRTALDPGAFQESMDEGTSGDVTPPDAVDASQPSSDIPFFNVGDVFKTVETIGVPAGEGLLQDASAMPLVEEPILDLHDPTQPMPAVDFSTLETREARVLPSPKADPPPMDDTQQQLQSILAAFAAAQSPTYVPDAVSSPINSTGESSAEQKQASPTAASPPQDSAPAAPSAPAEAEMRQQRLQERRRKNRLAAARSNARRKVHREGLVSALRDVGKRKDELSAREAELRAENRRLRDRAAGLWLSGAREEV